MHSLLYQLSLLHKHSAEQSACPDTAENSDFSAVRLGDLTPVLVCMVQLQRGSKRPKGDGWLRSELELSESVRFSYCIYQILIGVNLCGRRANEAIILGETTVIQIGILALNVCL